MTSDVNPMKGQCRYAEIIHEAVVRLLGREPESVLELGCGPGGNLLRFSKSLTRVGIDPMPANRDAFLAAKAGTFVLSDHDHLTRLPTNSFDVGITCSVLTHIENFTPALISLARVCKRLVLIEPVTDGPPRQAWPEDTPIWSVTWYHDYDATLRAMGVDYTCRRSPLSKRGSGPRYRTYAIVCHDFGVRGEAFCPLIIMNRPARYNLSLHGGFASTLCEVGAEPLFYGPSLGGVRQKPVCDYTRSTPWSELVRSSHANVLMVYRGNRADLNWANQKTMSNLGVPVIWIDVDFCYLRGKTDDLAARSDLHLLRHPSDLPFSRALRSALLPLSVDGAAYRYERMAGREGIGFSGAGYPTRKLAIDAVSATVLSERVSAVELGNFYRKLLAAITCCNGDIRYLNAKHFEIPATGAVLLTNNRNGLEQFLPEGTYCVFGDKAEGIVERWNSIQENRDEWEIRAAAAAKRVHAEHTHHLRWFQAIVEINRQLGTHFALGHK